eukprot:5337287-Pleurochrysis_carterae.AAC.1
MLPQRSTRPKCWNERAFTIAGAPVTPSRGRAHKIRLQHPAHLAWLRQLLVLIWQIESASENEWGKRTTSS